MDTSAAGVTVRKSRRKWWIGGALALVVVLVIALATAPAWIAPWARGFAQDAFAKRFHGRLTIEELDLAWTSRQRASGVEVLDPDGRRVARVDADLPSLRELIGGRGTRLGLVRLAATADLVADDAGRTNLERALEPRDASAKDDPNPKDGGGDWRESARELEVELLVDCDRLTWSDARTRAANAPIEIADLALKAKLERGERATLELDGAIASAGNRPLAVRASVERPFEPTDSAQPPRATLAVDLRSLPTGLIDAFASTSGALSRLIGPEVTLVAQGSGDPNGGEFELTLEGPNATVQLDALLADGVLRKKADGLNGRIRAKGLIESGLLAPLEAHGLRFVSSPDLQLVFSDAHRELHVAAALDAAARGESALQSLLSTSHLDLAFDLGDWRFTDERLGEPIAIEKLEGFLEIGPGDAGRPRAWLRLDAGDEHVHATVDDPHELVGSGALQLPAATEIRVNVARPQLSATAAIAIERNVARLLEPLTVALALDGSTRASLLGDALPEGARLEPLHEPARVVLTIPALQADLAPLLAERTAQRPLELAAVLGGLHAKTRAELGDWRWTDAKLAAAGQTVEVRALTISCDAAPGADAYGASVVATARLGDRDDASLEVRATVEDALGVARIAQTRSFRPLKLAWSASNVPGAWLAAYAGDGAATARLGQRFGLRGEVAARWPAGEPIAADLDVALDATDPPLTIAGVAKLSDPIAAQEQGLLPEIDVALELRGLELAHALVPPAFAASARELVGDSAKLSIVNRPTSATEQSLDASLEARGVRVRSSGRIADGAFRATGDAGLEATVAISPALLDAAVAGKLPAGAKLELAGESPALTIRARDLEVPLGAAAAADSAPKPFPLERVAATIAVELPTMTYAHPTTGGGAATRATLERVRLDATLRPGERARAKLTGSVVADPPGTIDVEATVEHVERVLAAAPADGAAPPPSIRLTGKLEQLPTALVDALASQQGLLVDVLGATVSVELSGSIPGDAGEPVRAKLTSPQARVTLDARVTDDEILVSSDQGGLDAQLRLTPLFGSRIVGNLVPLLVSVQQPPAAPPAAIQMRDFAMPMNADLRQLSGTVTLDLGEITYQLLPGLEQFLDPKVVGSKSAALKPIKIAIEQGVARYDSLEIPLGGKTVSFSGSFDLVEKSYRLNTKIPLPWLGKGVAKELDKLRDFIDPSTQVPIELRGTLTKPKLRIGEDFLKDLAEKAAGNALERGLQDLLGGKKKDK